MSGLLKRAFALAIGLSGACAIASPAKRLVFHLDFNTIQMDKEAVCRLLREVAAEGYDAVLWEVEDKVRWSSCPEAVAPDAFSKEEFAEILGVARALGLEPIPLLQTLGHAEYVLGCDRYAALRENPDRKNCYCPSRPETRRFLKRLLAEYLEVFGPDVKRVHLGGDEAHGYGACPSCSRRDPVELYVEHLDAIAADLRPRGVRPGVWHDMLQHFDGGCRSFRKLPEDFTLWYWEYFVPGDLPYQYWGETAERAVSDERKSGREVFFCCSVQCYLDDPFLVRYGMHRKNVRDAVEACARCDLSGLCVTSWSVHQGLKELQYPLTAYAAACYRKPPEDWEAAWAAVVRREFGRVSPSTMDDLTVWDYELGKGDGRYWSGYKDGAVPARGHLRDSLKDADARRKYVERCRRVLSSVESALAKLRGQPAEGRTARVDLAIRAGELKAAYHRAQLNVLGSGEAKALPVDSVRAFYAREQTGASAEKSTQRLFEGLREKQGE